MVGVNFTPKAAKRIARAVQFVERHSPTPNYWRRRTAVAPRQSQSIRPVFCTQVGGSEGDEDNFCTFTYDIYKAEYDADSDTWSQGDLLASAVTLWRATSLRPAGNRIAVGPMVAGDQGFAFKIDGTWFLDSVNEYFESEVCTDADAPTATQTTTYTATLGETVRADPSGAGFTITTPQVTVNQAGRRFTVSNVTSSTNTITIQRNGSGVTTTIKGATTDTITTAWQSKTYEFDGVSAWIPVATG